MKTMTAVILSSALLFAGAAYARDAADLAEEDFRSQSPPDYAALARLQEANKRAEMNALAPAWAQPAPGADITPLTSRRPRRS